MPGYLGAICAFLTDRGRYAVIERLSKKKHGADLYQVTDSPAAILISIIPKPVRNEEMGYCR